jgi:two-component system, chemotaxis family, CheB/CheR fusion protein
VSTPVDPSFEALLEFLKHTRAIDFTGYKRASLERRFRRRLSELGCASFGDYLDYLEVHPDEYETLFDRVLIPVTEFFRDPPTWEYLRDEVLPRVLEPKAADEPVRVWSAGCASGQEAYSIAMLLAEALGDDAYRARVKIYATDLDEEALNTARLALYTEHEMESVPEDMRERYFDAADGRFAFRKDLRRAIIFGRNNLVQDSPISRLDLLICRNTLMYFTAETQSRILRHFHFALVPTGALILGKSEMIVSHRELFDALDVKKRVFKRRARAASPVRRVGADSDGSTAAAPPAERTARDIALEVGPTPQLIVACNGTLAFANVEARALFHIGAGDIGRPFQDLELSYRPVELREPIAQALRERRRLAVGETRFAPSEGEERRLDISVIPLISDGASPLGVTVNFEDITRFAALQQELDGHRNELEQAYEELQSTIDELETTNEELQSANEELQTTNEELQSTNEELETMNEELHSTNAELETINDELHNRTDEVNELNDFLEAIVTSLGVGIVVVDPTGRVQIWNHSAEEQWGVREDEAVAQEFLGLDLGLPTDQVAPALRAVLAGTSDREQLELEAVNRRGHAIVCSTSVLPLRAFDGNGDGDGDGRIRGAIVLMEDTPVDG